jgi:basic membrane protein A
VVSNSGIRGPNYSGLDTKNEESGYMAGFIAGTVTKTKKVGMVMAYEDVLPFRRGTLGFEMGVEAACPDCEISKSFVGSSEDIAGGKEAALAMYDAGVDVIWQYADATGLGVIEAGEETGNMVIGSGADQLELGPNSIVSTTVQSLGPVIFDVVQGAKNGTFVADEPHLYGYDNGAYSLGELNMNILSEEEADAILAVRDQLVNGEIDLPHIAE